MLFLYTIGECGDCKTYNFETGQICNMDYGGSSTYFKVVYNDYNIYNVYAKQDMDIIIGLNNVAEKHCSANESIVYASNQSQKRCFIFAK